MVIKGLLAHSPQGAAPMYRLGTPDVDEAVGVTIKAYRELGFTPDVARATQTIGNDFRALAKMGYDGRLWVAAPAEVSFHNLLGVADGKRPAGVEPVWRYHDLWISGAEKKSYTEAELNDAPAKAVARLALFNADTDTGVDPILHFLEQPFDTMYRRGVATQVDAVAAAHQAFEDTYDDFELKPVDHRDFAMLALMDRIRGIKPPEQILCVGFMRIPQLGRRTVAVGSIVGNVDSIRDDGRLDLSGTDGGPHPLGGVGLSVGLKEA